MKTEFIAKVTLALATGKVKNSEFFKIGRDLGLKNKEIHEIRDNVFPDLKSGKDKTAPASKVLAKKVSAKPKIVPGTIDEIEIPYFDPNVVENTETSFVWIATEEEIASTEDLHKTDY